MDALPRRFGRYVLFDHIGKGGMADIYLARVETELGAARRVVVKQILPELSKDPKFARMLVDEAKLVAGLRHANIAQVLDLGREKERLFITMEYVEGFDLNQLLATLSKRRIALPAEFALFIVREMLAGLDFAHRASDDGKPLAIVHRDVSPSNVLISFEGEVKLCDFGIARALGTPDERTSRPPTAADVGGNEKSRIAGKAAYMSPEHARGEKIDARADLFAAGIVLWELMAGRRLYRGTDEQMLALARDGAIPPLPDRGLPKQDELSAILDRAFAIDVTQRWPSAAEMLRAIDGYSVRNKLFASQIKFGAFLSQHFEMDVVQARREKELAAESALEQIDAEPPPPRISTPTPAPPRPPTPVPEPAVAALAAQDTRKLAAVKVETPAPSRWPLYLVAALIIASALAGAGWLVFLR
jgi:serine/threonine protein kinase